MDPWLKLGGPDVPPPPTPKLPDPPTPPPYDVPVEPPVSGRRTLLRAKFLSDEKDENASLC